MTLTCHFDVGRRGFMPRAVVVHTTDGSHVAALSWFMDPQSRVSAHYLVALDGRVRFIVNESDTAYHAGHEPHPDIPVLGDDPPNLVTIGIEFEDGGLPHDVVRPDAQYVAGARLLAGISRRWDIPLDHDHVLPHRLINQRKTCPGNLNIDRLLLMANAELKADVSNRPRLIVLLPARNAEAALPAWFESVGRFADAVVALDDGSTDRTAEVLEAHPLVAALLRNPRRETYEGWNDSANRNALLDAAAQLSPDWIFSLDADELITSDDAAVLRQFIDTDALPGLVYGMACFRMWGGKFDPRPSWVYRLFAHMAGQRFPAEQLHFDPVPTSLERSRHVRTSVRIQHWGSADEEQRVRRIAKYREADPGGRFPAGHGGLYEVPSSLMEWPSHDDTKPVIVGARPKGPTTGDGVGRQSPVGRRLVVLVPARNAEDDLPAWFESVERFADAVVALDDGSTDRTAELLEAHPMVEVLLRNPRRDTYEGWDDSANRNALLEAAGQLDPDWILSLDVDERISADDAEVLRSFVDSDALPGVAYGMACHRMIGDLEHWDRNALWVYRLFAYEPEQRFPRSRLHFVPIPEAIPRDRWLRTTIRIQHISSLTANRRKARLEKYREADPDSEFQSSYDNVAAEPTTVFFFEPRSPGLGVLVSELKATSPSQAALVDPYVDELDYDMDAPALSAIVISRNDEDRIERVVRSVVDQQCTDPFEVILVNSGTDRTVQIVRDRFPDVRVVELDHPALPGEARNAGLRFARGDYISFPGSHVELEPGSLEARIQAHDRGWTMVTGSTFNGTDTAAGWAAYFLDNSTALPGRPSGELTSPPAHCSYDAVALFAAGGFPQDVRAGEDTRVNQWLFSAGYKAFRSAEIHLTHANRSRDVAHLVRHFFQRGHAMTQHIRAVTPGDSDSRVREFLWTYPTRRMARVDSDVRAWGGDLGRHYRRVRPLVRLGVLASWVGAHVELRRDPIDRRTDRRTEQIAQGATPSPLTKPLRVARDVPAERAGTRAIFLHIPKTAGRTMLSILEREYEGLPTLRLYSDEEIAAFMSMEARQRRCFQLVSGHMAFGVGAMLPGPSTYITLLRDPVERIVSHYHYVCSRPTSDNHAEALRGILTLDDYVRSSAFAHLVNNGQTRLLGTDFNDTGTAAGEETLDRAKKVLERDDVIFGLQERFDESVLVMMNALGWGYPAFGVENRGVGRAPLHNLSPEIIEIIEEHNYLDRELYEFAVQLFEERLEHVSDLDEQMERLRLASRYRGTSL